jgi:hypothetical protein
MENFFENYGVAYVKGNISESQKQEQMEMGFDNMI